MVSVVLQQVQAVRHLLVRLVRWRAVAMALSIVLITGLVLSLIDYFVQPNNAVSRWLLTIIWLISGVIAWYRFLRPAFLFEPTNVNVARWIESNLGSFNCQISSSIAFLERESGGDTNPFQRHVVSETESMLREVDLEKTVNSRPILISLSLLGLVVLHLLSLAIGHPGLAVVGAQRLAMPWRHQPWPAVHRLTFNELPQKVGRLSSLLVQVKDDSGSLPPDIRLQFRPVARRDELVEQPMQINGQVAECLLENIEQDLEIRAVGGDDTSMPWHLLKVLEAPDVENVTLTASPPTYSRRPSEPIVSGATLLQNTAIILSGTATQELAEAWLHVAAADSRGSESVRLYTAGNRREFYLPEEESIIVDQDLRLSLEVIGIDGVSSGNALSWEVKCAPDIPPTIDVDWNSTEQVGPSGYISVRTHSTDDVGIRTVTLKFSNSADEIHPFRTELNSAIDRQDQFRVDASLLQRLGPQYVEFFATATDLFGHTSTSGPHTVELVTEGQLAEIVDERLAAIGQQLDRLQKTEAELAEQLDQALTHPEMPDLQKIEARQDAVVSALVESKFSVSERIEHLIEYVDRNRLPWNSLIDQLYRCRRRIDSLSRKELSQIRAALSSTSPHTVDVVTIQTVSRLIKQVARELAQMREELLRFSGRLEVMNELVSIVDTQRQLLQETEAHLDAYLAEQIDVESIRALGDRQAELGSRVERFLASIVPAHHASDQDDDSSATLQAIRRRLVEGQTIRLMHDASHQIAQMQFSLALQHQQQALNVLTNADQIISSTWRPPSPADIVRLLRQVRTRQVETLVATRDLAALLDGRQPTDRRQRIAIDQLATKQSRVIQDLGRILRLPISREERMVLEQALATATTAFQNMEIAYLESETTSAMSSVIELLDLLLNASRPDLDDEPNQIDQHGPGRSNDRATNVVISLQQLIMNRTAALVKKRANGAAVSAEELEQLATMQENVAKYLSGAAHPESVEK